MMKKEPLRNRIVGSGVEDPEQLLANPANWRIHPKHQQDALEGVLEQVGWVQEIIVNRTTQHVVDGHLRVALSISRGEKEIPVKYVELTEDEEKLVLSTLDPLAALAGTDAQKLDELLQEVNSDSAAVQQMLAGLAEGAGIYGEGQQDSGAVEQNVLEGMTYKLIVECDDEHHQKELLERLEGEGLTCHLLIS